MKKFFTSKKFIVEVLLLILVVSNFGISFAYWASTINGNQAGSSSSVQIGEWDFTDVELELEISTFRSNHAIVLALTTGSVTVTDKSAVEAALAAYGLLSEAAKDELVAEESLLLSLLTQIIALENSEFLDFEAYPYDSGLTGTVVMNARTWYANDVYISNDPSYDVWRDTRSLALRSTAYFESQDLFINGVDKITLYHGALNFNNGASFAFKIEYELQSNPGVWVTLQDGGIDLIIDVISGNPMTYSEINVNITEALNIRFTPVISTTTDYINLDDIRIFEHVVSSNLEATTFRTIYAGALALTVGTVEISDKPAVEAALTAYDLLSIDAQTELSIEKALLDSLLVEITVQEDILEATAAVSFAEDTYVQADLDQAQLLVTALPDGAEKTALQNRINDLQITINTAATFRSDYAATLALTTLNVQTTDKPAVDAALAAYNLLSEDAKEALTVEKLHLDSLLAEINTQIPTETQVTEFLNAHATALTLTVGTVTIADQSIVQLALDAYSLLSTAAQAELTVEKALLDSLIAEIFEQQAILEATTAVLLAESSLLHSDVDEAQLLVDALIDGVIKTDLQDRIDTVQSIITEIVDFRADHASTLLLTVSTVSVTDKTAVESALAAFGLLSDTAKTELAAEETLLLSLLTEIIAFENSEFLDFEAYVYDALYTGTIVMNSRTWYANNLAISNSPSYDVWRDTRSLALKTGSYFASQDYFMNGIDKITLYHGALNYNNGTSFAFKVEYALQSNPSVWLTVQEGGSDLIIDVISGNPMTFAEINVSITEAINIRFTPVIGNTTDYINLDDIRIYENVVSSELEATTFRTVYQGVLALTVGTVNLSHKDAVLSALSSYDLLSTAAQTDLTTEKALLDTLLVEILAQEAILVATDAVVVAETSKLQTDLDAAQILVTALPNGTIKTDLQNRLDVVQNIITTVSTYQSTYATVLALTVETVQTTDKTAVEQAIAAYDALSEPVKTELSSEYTLLLSLLVEINNQLPTATQVQEFRDNHAVVLALTTVTVNISDRLGVEAALTAYALLSEAAKTELLSEKSLLDSLLARIIELEAIALVVIAENSNLQLDHDTALITVNALPNGLVKTDLLDRLVVVQQTIDAMAAAYVDGLITALPSSGNLLLTDEAQVVAARSAFEALTVNQKALVVNEALLISAEAELIALAAATQAVITAEGSILQADVDTAQALVTALSNGAPKTDLQNRLNAVQDIIDVQQAQTIINNYFASNLVVVSTLNNNSVKQTAFLAKANEIVSGLGVSITVTNSQRINRNNTIYTITVSKNAASVSFTVSVNFTR
jgi:hypothetical protein